MRDRTNCAWARTKPCPCSLEFVIEAGTQVATMAQKMLATAAINCKVDRCGRFSVLDTAPDVLNGKKCVLWQVLLLFELSTLAQEFN